MTAPTPADVSALRELLAAATPVGEWRAMEGDLEGKPVSEYARTLFANREKDGTTTARLFLTVAPNPIDPELGATVVPALTGDGPQAQANAHLIAAAVNALPDLLARAEAADALRAGVEAFLDNDYREAQNFVRIETGHAPTVKAMALADNRLRALLAESEAGS